MAQISRCSNCGGEEVYKPESGTLVCTRCGSSFPVSEGNSAIIRRPYSPTYTMQNQEAEQYICSTCGAKIVMGTDGEVKRCSSCGNLSVKKTTTLHNVPDGIVPFTLTRSRAGEIFRSWVGSRKFAPNDLKQMAKLEKISGLYVPVWEFNYISVWRYRAIGIKRHTDSDGEEEFSEYPVDKVKENVVNNQIFSGSSKINNDYLQGLGGWNTKDIRPYSTDYLLGFSGLETDVDVHKIYSDFTNEISQKNERTAKSRLESDYYRYESFFCQTRFKDVTFSHFYVPIWANHYTYKGKLYHCYINGQTGKATGKAPKSFFKISSLVLGILGAIGVGILLLLKLM